MIASLFPRHSWSPYEHASVVLSLFVFSLGVFVLIGWIAGIDLLVRIRPDFSAMVPSTALCFVIVGGALCLGVKQVRQGVMTGAAAAIAAIALADLVVIFADAAVGIDSLIWPRSGAFLTDAMAFGTAFCFLNCAICLVTFHRGRKYTRLYEGAATLGLVLSGVATIGYVFDAEGLYEVFAFTAMALHTSIAFLVIFSAFLVARPDDGWIGIITGRGIGSAGARRLLPIVVLGNFGFCFLVLMATEYGFFGENFRLSVLAIAMIALSTMAILKNARIENEAQSRLAATLQEVEALANVKDLLLRELNHRVKNNLQQINAMIRLEWRDSDPAGRAKLDSLGDRVRALGLVHHKLLKGSDGSEVAFDQFMASLIEDTRKGLDLDERGIDLTLDVEPATMTMDATTSIALLVNELLMNAVKHAFPEGRRGTIRVGFALGADGEYIVSVDDDGIGTPDHAAPGVGSRIVSDLLLQLKASAEKANGDGTKWRIVIPSSVNEDRRYV